MKSKKKDSNVRMVSKVQKTISVILWVILRPMFMTLNFVYILCNVLPYFDPNIKEEKKRLVTKERFY